MDEEIDDSQVLVLVFGGAWINHVVIFKNKYDLFKTVPNKQM